MVKVENAGVVIVKIVLSLTAGLWAAEYHVSPAGNDQNSGAPSSPFRTISAAAAVAMPGDTITVHEGVYRERVDPPRGGLSERQRIIYRAAPGERVVVRGSEPVSGWRKLEHDTWTVTLPEDFFGQFNPFDDEIRGDWFNPKGRTHHTGAVYLNGHWLIEAASQEQVMRPFGAAVSQAGRYLVNVAWLKPGPAGRRLAASAYTDQSGVQTAPCSEGGDCVGWIEAGDWMTYAGVDFGPGCDRVLMRLAAVEAGGIVELRLDSPRGELLGTHQVGRTGGWQAWATVPVAIRPVSGTHTLCLVFRLPEGEGLWFARVVGGRTTIWAQFKDVNPNEQLVEVNARRTVFYPEKPGRNYITVRGFTLEHAATPWAPPTAEQIGLIGTHWSKGWIIENNTIRYSVCTGVTLGKHGDEYDNTSANTARGYIETIKRATDDFGWSRETIGHHLVRNNRISHCEQAGIVGSLGAAFSTVVGNVIHDCHVRKLFGGAEMAGIKFHAPIDSIVQDNHIYRTWLGIWLDWMTQGTRVTGNCLHDNERDLFLEVNHGPFLVDNNLLLSPHAIAVNSQGGAYVHNLVAGRVSVAHNERRQTPYHLPHSTAVAGLAANPSGDDRYYNNIFVNPDGLTGYDQAALAVFMAGNVFVNGARPCRHEAGPVMLADLDPQLRLFEREGALYLGMNVDERMLRRDCVAVTGGLLGKAAGSGAAYENRDGSPVRVDRDYRGRRRSGRHPQPGPFEPLRAGQQILKVWPKEE